MTNHWCDLENSDCILIQGCNAAENHPISFKWVMRAKDKGATVIHVDPRFTRTSAKADIYAHLRSGTDIAFLGGMIKYILETEKYFKDYVVNYTNASFIVDDKFSFDNGLFSGYDPNNFRYDSASWKLKKDADGIPVRDETLKNPRCVLQLLKKHYSRYTLDKVSSITGTSKESLLKVYEAFSATGKPDKAGTVMYALGQTQHSVGTQNIRTLCMIQLLLGNIGVAGGGVNALRGEPNVQGSTDQALLFHILPGYISAPNSNDTTLESFLKRTTPVSKDPKSVNWLSNTPKYMVSLLKSFYGDKATKENDYGYDWLPKYDKGVDYSIMTLFDEMYKGTIKGFTCFAQNPACSMPNSRKTRAALGKLDWLVTFNIFDTETANFWHGPGMNPKDIQTEVFSLPATAAPEKSGSQTNSGRWIQWKYAAGKAPGDCKPGGDVFALIQKKLQELYAQEGGVLPEPVVNMFHDHFDAHGEYDPLMVAKQMNGYFLEDVKIGDVQYKKGELVPAFANLQADGTTCSGNWLHTGTFTRDGQNLMARRGKEDPTGLKMFHNWSFSWPANRRILYNRASCDPQGKPYNPNRVVVEWKDNKWVGDVVDGGGAPSGLKDGKLPFIMMADGFSALFGPGMPDGPFPEHYEPMESPLKANLMSKQMHNPIMHVYGNDMDKVASASLEFPIVMSTYSCTEHWCTGSFTRFQPWLMEAMPGVYVEMSEELAKEKGIANGEKVKVSSARGELEATAMVTTRLRPFLINGKTVHQMGMTYNYGWLYPKNGGDSANNLTLSIGDGNARTPEYKAFMANVEKL